MNVPGTFSFTTAAGTVLNAGSSQSENVTFTPTNTTDYVPTTATVTVNVAKATPTVNSVGAVNITYGTALTNGQLSGTAQADVNGATVSVPGTFSYTTAGSVLHGGNGQSVGVTFTPTDSADFTTATSSVTVNVSQATPTVVSVNTVNIVTPTALDNSQLSGSAQATVNGATVSVAGTFSYTTAAGTVLAVGGGQIENVTFAPTDSTDYTTASSTVTVNVASQQAVTPSLTINPVNITYGTPLANGQLSGTAQATVGGSPVSVAGTFTYTTAAGTVLNGGDGQTESVTFSPTDVVDYKAATTTVTVNVAKAAPTIESVNPVSLTYGTALANGQLSGTAQATVNGNVISLPGTYSYTTTAGTVLTAGSAQSEGVTFTPTDSTDFTTATSTVSVSVGPGNTDRRDRQCGEHYLWHGTGGGTGDRHGPGRS